MPEASVRRDGTGNPKRRVASRPHSQAEAYATSQAEAYAIWGYLPLFTGVNLIFLISSTICPSRTMPDTAVIACTTFS
jgi:hypothetical protein